MSEEPIKQDDDSRDKVGSEKPATAKSDAKSVLPALWTFLIVLVVVGAIVWIRFSSSRRVDQITPTPTPSVTVLPESPPAESTDNDTPEQAEKHAALDNAISDFIVSKYKDWKIKGKSLKDDSVNNRVIYDLDLTSGAKEKIVPVVVEKFQKENEDDEYWIAIESSRIDLIEMEIDAIKHRLDGIEKAGGDSGKDDDNDGS